MKQLFHKLLHLGVKETYPFSLQHQVYTINRINLINVIFAFVFIVCIQLYIKSAFVSIMFFCVIPYFFTFVCNHLGKHRLAKLTHVFANLFSAFMLCGLFGYQNSIYVVLLMVGLISAIMNGLDHEKDTAIIIALTFVFWAILYAINFSFYEVQLLSNTFLRWLLRVVYIAMFAEIIIASYINIRDARLEEEKIRESESELAKRYADLHKNHQDLDQFVYRVSHDLRAPLVSALGLVDICKKEESEMLDFYLTLQEASLKKLDILIHDILQYARNSRTELKVTQVDFHALLAEVFDFNTYKDPAQRIQKKINIAQDTPFYTDTFRLKIILNNLISNALQYQDFHKPASYIEINIQTYPTFAQVVIKDNGLGIDEAHLPHIFDMFYRANIKSVGSGLGLYIIKEVLDKLNGKIEIQSKAGEMTICTLQLPNLFVHTEPVTENVVSNAVLQA